MLFSSHVWHLLSEYNDKNNENIMENTNNAIGTKKIKNFQMVKKTLQSKTCTRTKDSTRKN